MIRFAAIGLGSLLAFGALSYGGLHWAGFLGKAGEQIRHDIFKESQAYRDGMKNELNRLYVSYQSADQAGRIGISNAVRDQFASVDTADFPPHLQSFLSQVGAR